MALTVPAAGQREGNVLQLLALGSNYQIYDLRSQQAITCGLYQNDLLPANIIPASLTSEKSYPGRIQLGAKLIF